MDQGTLILSLDGVAAPKAVGSFIYLAQQGFFDETSCHRLVTDTFYVLQCGSPDGTSYGDPGYIFGPVENAPSDNIYSAGTVAMARGEDPSSMGSQFFIVYKDSFIPLLSGEGFTVFAQVTDGLDIVEAIAAAGTATGSSDDPPAEPAVFHEVTVS
jgi:peptidyl-prolyl cis-trans isomerase B (cyclophilin B)